MDPDFKFDFGKAQSQKLWLISFLNILTKLPRKSKILIHGHVKIFLNLVTFSLIVLIKIVQVIKSCVRYFLTNFYFSPNDSPSKTMKNVKGWFKSFKSSFRCRDIQFLVLPPSPLFLSVSHCFVAWSKTNLKVYDVSTV